MLTETINAYPFKEYADDYDVSLFFGMFNAASQDYLDWFNSASLAYYPGLTGSLLQWVGAGLYGQPYFSAIEAAGTPAIGPLNTTALNTIPLNSYVAPTETFYDITDDIFQRILTWNLYKGDGKRFCPRWLKRRIMRFLVGVNGIDPQPYTASSDGQSLVEDPDFVVGCENTYGISVQFTTSYLSAPTQLTPTTVTTGGSLPAATHYYFKIVAVNGFGHTLPSSEQTIETGSGSTNKITINFDAVSGASAIQVWFSTTTGTEASYFTTTGTATSFSFTTTTGATSGTIPTASTALSGQTCTVTLNQLVLSALTQLTPNILQTFQALFLAPGTPDVSVSNWVLEKPLEYTYVVNIDTSLTALGSPVSLSVTGASASETTGPATVSALGGSGSYTYAWAFISGGSGITITSPTADSTTFSTTTLTAGGSKTGVAQCTVTDTSTSDTATWSVNVSLERVSAPSATPAPTSISAAGASSNVTSAQVLVSVTGGAGPYHFVWTWSSGGTDISIDSPSTSATTFTAIGLSTGGTDSGTALCTVTDAYGQTTTCAVPVSITRATPVSASTTPTSLTVLSSSASETTATTTVSASGGITPYTYSWAWASGGAGITIDSRTSATTAFSASLALNTTATGVAVCTITDSVGQQAQVTCSVSITRASAVTASVSPSSQSSGGTATTQTTGVSTVTASGGSGSYTYSWSWISGGSHIAINSPSLRATSFTGSGMTQGNTYTGIARCTVTDGYGQQTTVSVSVSITCVANPVQHTYTSGSGTETVPGGGYNAVIIEIASPGGGGEGGYFNEGLRESFGGEGGDSGTYCRSQYSCAAGKTLVYVNGTPGAGGPGPNYGAPGYGTTSTVSSGSLAITTMTAPGGNTGNNPSGGNQANTPFNTGAAGSENHAGAGGAALAGEYISGYGNGGLGGLGPGSGESGGGGIISFYYFYQS